MNLTAEEKLMFDVMKAIYDSGIPISFKGSMVLKVCLLEAGYTEDTRHTVDIDANWNTDNLPTAEQMTSSIQSALQKAGLDLDVSLYWMYGEGRSAGFELTDKSADVPLFTMNMDVNRPPAATKIYDVEGVRFRGASSFQIVADKLSAISTDKVFRRVKDVVDLYYLSQVVDFDAEKVRKTLIESGKTLGSFQGFLFRTQDLRHAYEKFRFSGDVNKPSFEEVYHSVKSYIGEVLPKTKTRDMER